MMVLFNVTKFHKILIKSVRLREWTSLDRRTYERKYVCKVLGEDIMVLNNVTKFHKILLKNIGL